MDQGLVSPDWAPLVGLLETVLMRVQSELGESDPGGPAPVSLSVSTASTAGLVCLASLGEGAELVEAQADQLGGPVPDAIATGLPFAVADLWGDPRWPRLTREEMTRRAPQLAQVWARIRGMAVLPVAHVQQSLIVLTCTLPAPATERTVQVLARYRQLVESAIAVVHATSVNGPEKVLAMLTGRAVIEQAKGAIIAVTGAGADQAWRTLRTASQDHNVKLRAIAIALIEYLGGTPAERPEGLPDGHTDAAAEKAARGLWEQLTAPPSGKKPDRPRVAGGLVGMPGE